MDNKEMRIGGKTVVFVLRGTPRNFRIEMITDSLQPTVFFGSDLIAFFGKIVTDHESFKKNFTAV